MTNFVITPLMSEKSVAKGEAERTYTFLVPKKVSKIVVAKEVSVRFKVKVVAVNTALIKGKPKETIVRRGRQRTGGHRRDFKKAYVKLAEGETIKLFEEKK